MESKGYQWHTAEATEHEKKVYDPASIGLVTTTQYERFTDQDSNDFVRGNLAIQMLREAQAKGLTIFNVDSEKSPAEFRAQLQQVGIDYAMRTIRSLSGQRRQAISKIGQREGIQVICLNDPEKISIVSDCINQLVRPLLDNEADIVVPKRNDLLFEQTYPPQQVYYERRSNEYINGALRSREILSPEVDDLDLLVGVRLFRNDPVVIGLFQHEYKMKNRGFKIDKNMNMELWPNAQFFPVISALHKGFRVKSVEVPYKHPASQTQYEMDHAVEFYTKRRMQLENIVLGCFHFIRYLAQNPKSRLERVD